ncbi:hypothetical protein TNIN_369081 [Trichonephila inaurata madagascariensis]|uniref:Uncharacterized protein n=1 Tax=Trichonephila inaurata madagascariensis TaxID=2747483 RepID=A0A8X7C5R7_9ARAC|nr:hypothetical protein TNIN_369081 [Trichonephila inaurata madagascariensis]
MIHTSSVLHPEEDFPKKRMVTSQSSVAEISQTRSRDGSSTIVESWSCIIHFEAHPFLRDRPSCRGQFVDEEMRKYGKTLRKNPTATHSDVKN